MPWRLVATELIGAEWRIYASVILPSLVQIMACRLVGAKPLSKPMWNINNWTPRNKHQWSFNAINTCSFKKMHLKISSGKWQPYCLSINVLKYAWNGVTFFVTSHLTSRLTICQSYSRTIDRAILDHYFAAQRHRKLWQHDVLSFSRERFWGRKIVSNFYAMYLRSGI